MNDLESNYQSARVTLYLVNREELHAFCLQEKLTTRSIDSLITD